MWQLLPYLQLFPSYPSSQKHLTSPFTSSHAPLSLQVHDWSQSFPYLPFLHSVKNHKSWSLTPDSCLKSIVKSILDLRKRIMTFHTITFVATFVNIFVFTLAFASFSMTARTVKNIHAFEMNIRQRPVLTTKHEPLIFGQSKFVLSNSFFLPFFNVQSVLYLSVLFCTQVQFFVQFIP